MGKLHDSAHKTQDREFKLLLASGLLCSYERSTPEELYQKALKCFEMVIDVLEDAATARSVSALVSRPVTDVENSARTVIDLLLFNKEADPYVSLGLPRNADHAEANRRWKRLMGLYHPDRFPEAHEYDEKAKKINDAYDKLQRSQWKDSYSAVDQSANQNDLHIADPVNNFRIKKKLPVFILALTIFACIISLWLYIII